MATLTTTCAVAFGCITILYIGGRYIAKRADSLPPGPLGLPWIGSALAINRGSPWLTFHEWSRTYGDLVHFQLFGRDVIVINSEKVAKDLLDTRSSNNSDRPSFVINEMLGVDFATALLPYGDRWRLQRRLLHQTFRSDAMARFLPLQHDKACQLLRELFRTPKQFRPLLFDYTCATVLNSTYDYDPTPRNDAFITTMTKILEIGQHFVAPDVLFTGDAFQMLLKLPAWFPGMSLKRKLAAGNKLTKEYVETTSKHSLRRLDSSVAPFMIHDAMQGMEEKGRIPDEMWTKALKEAAATTCLVGSHTSRSVLVCFFLMMALNQEVQEKAQAQLDAVVGKGRLPRMDDRPLLPIMDAIFRETLRRCVVIPLSAPHAAVNDDVYAGFHIPKGAVLVANVWAMAHDETKFPDPYAFKPERFLNEDGSLKPSDTENIAYGFGRRICVGKHFADTSLWSVMAKILTVYKILKPLNEDGIEIPIKPGFSSGGFSIHPLPFECRIVPRMPGMDAQKLEELIAASTI